MNKDIESLMSPRVNSKYIYIPLTNMRVFLLRFVRVGDPTAQLTDMYDTSPESRVCGAVDRLLFISIALICGMNKAKCNLASRRSYVIKRNRDCCDFPKF